jgi:hypothetical protein
MVKLEEPRVRCRYYDAIAAIGLMKGMPMIDVACDDALISALMEMDAGSVQQVVERYDRKALGYPTPEKIARIAAACGQAPPRLARAPEPVPRRCRPVYTISGRLAGLVWGVITGLATTVAVGWITAAPWLERVASWLAGLLPPA